VTEEKYVVYVARVRESWIKQNFPVGMFNRWDYARNQDVDEKKWILKKQNVNKWKVTQDIWHRRAYVTTFVDFRVP